MKKTFYIENKTNTLKDNETKKSEKFRLIHF